MSTMIDIPEVALGQAVAVDWNEARYHADEHTVSRSMLETLRKSPQLFHALHVARTLPPEPPTAAMQFGTHVHLCVLEPERWAKRLYPPAPERPPEANGRAKADTIAKQLYLDHKAAEADWRAGIKPNSIVLTVDEIAKVEATAKAIRSHEFAARLFARPGRNEQTILWREPTTGTLIRVRIDRLVRVGKLAIVLDLKTTSDERPDLFATSCARYGYHRQAAVYIDAVRALLGPDVEVEYVLAVVSTSSRVYDDCCYQFAPEAIALGREQYLNRLAELAHRRQVDDWRADHQRSCQVIDLPRWAYLET